MLRDDGVVRQDRDVSFLSSNGWTSTKLDGYTPGTTVLYEAQTSCLVVGHHSTAWTAHMLTDSYFADSEDTEYNEDTVNSWEEQRQDDGKPDPFTLGQTLADTPFLGARDYFITVLATRLKRVYHEWDLVTEYASRGVSKWQREAEAVPTLSAAWTFQTPAKSLSISLAPSCVKHTRMKHARMISDLLTDLHASLSDMLSEQERFLPTVQEMFCDDAGPVSASNRPRLRRGRLDEIETTIWRLRRRQTQLQNMRDKMLRKVYPQGRVSPLFTRFTLLSACLPH